MKQKEDPMDLGLQDKMFFPVIFLGHYFRNLFKNSPLFKFNLIYIIYKTKI